MPEILQTLNTEYGVSVARNYHPEYGEWPILMVHSPGMAYAFDSHNIGLDSPEAAMSMLNVFGLHEISQPFAPGPYTDLWTVLLDRDGDEPRESQLRGPHPLAPIGPLSRYGRVDGYWRAAVRDRDGLTQLMFIWGVDLAELDHSQLPEAMTTAAAQHRVAGATVRVLR